jgi:hypothetical protein
MAASGHTHGAGGHTHEALKEQASEKQIIEASKKHINMLIQTNKLDSSWKSNRPAQVKQQKLNDRLEWVVQYRNPQIKDTSKMTLFVFVDLYGKVKAANHTGK